MRTDLTRRGALALGLALPALGRAHAQGTAWRPDRPIRAIVPFAPGGTTDVVARVVAEGAAAQLGQPVIVENRPGGAAGLVGMDAVAKAAPDGNTILIHSNAQVIAPALVARLPFNPIDDFAPIALLGRVPQVLVVNPRSPAKDMASLLAWLRAEPGKHHFASAGIGSAVHLGGEVFRAVARVDIQPVHYRGGGPAMQAVITGEAVFTVDPVASATGHIRGGSVRPICIAGPARVATLPDIPTAAEAGLPAFRSDSWVVALAPARTPAAVLAALQSGFQAAMQAQSARMAELGVQLATDITTGDQLMAFMRQDMQRSVNVLREAGVKPE